MQFWVHCIDKDSMAIMSFPQILFKIEVYINANLTKRLFLLQFGEKANKYCKKNVVIDAEEHCFKIFEFKFSYIMSQNLFATGQHPRLKSFRKL